MDIRNQRPAITNQQEEADPLKSRGGGRTLPGDGTGERVELVGRQGIRHRVAGELAYAAEQGPR